MLPSTGYFKGENCPFYASGLCERPYCHFRHIKKDAHDAADDLNNSEILQALISQAVKKVFQHADNISPQSPTTEHKPGKATYNPTPIAELNKINNDEAIESNDTEAPAPKRHIPVPYTPHRPPKSRIKQPGIGEQNEKLTLIDVSNLNKPYTPVQTGSCSGLTYAPNSAKDTEPVPYKPPGETNVNGTYLPGSSGSAPQIYMPTGCGNQSSSSYVPTEISELEKQIIFGNAYEPIGSKAKSKLTYNPGGASVSNHTYSPSSSIINKESLVYKPTLKPTPKYPCFSSDEDEPITKKSKTEESAEKIGLEDLECEFDAIGQILDEENDENNTKKSKDMPPSKNSSRSKSSSSKSHKNKSDEKSHKSKSNETSHKSVSHSKDSKSDEKRKSHDKKTEKKHSHSKSKSKQSDKSREKESDKKHCSKTSEKSRKSGSTKPDLKISDSKKSEHSSKHGKTSKSKPDKEPVAAVKSDDDFLFDEDILTALSDSEPEDVNEQCLKIFEEYMPAVRIDPEEASEAVPPEEMEDSYTGKKRTSLISVPLKVKKIIAKPDFKANAAQTMADRLAKVRQYHKRKAAVEPPPPPVVSQPPQQVNNSMKMRIAHVPNVSTLLHAKKVVPSAPSKDVSQPSTSTMIQTVAKGSSRTAHIPSDKFIDRPGVLEPLGSKIPVNIRSRFLNMMIDECLKIYMAHEDAYARAQQEELTTSKKCSAVPIYRNSAMMAISRLRKELQDAGGVKKSSDLNNKVSHDRVLVGKLDHVSWSIEGKNRKVQDLTNEFRGIKFYNNVSKWVLSEEDLQDNGFPRPHPSGEKGRAKIYVVNTRQKPPKGNLRNCARCNRDFVVDKKGFAIRTEECFYHPNRKYKFRGEAKYQCCGQDGSAEGCASAPCHVYEYVDFENLRGFVRTLPRDEYEERDYGVYALDCEMCYTTHGLDLTRVTVIDPRCKVIYETFVKPLYPIIDYNTRYSGITEEQMQNVTTSLLEVQATLLHMFSDKTILVGHSLESDFKALKLIHETVIDTSVLYPHKMGPPFKRALRNLTSEYLKKIIQNSVGGHDSAEDATVCMELIQFKLKEELKLR